MGQGAFDVLRQIHAAREFETSFRSATGLTFRLKPVVTGDGGLLVDPGENPLCALVCSTAAGRALCHRVQSRIRRKFEAKLTAQQLHCPVGLTVVAVPVVVSGEHVAILHTNRLFVRAPQAADIARFADRLEEWGGQPPRPQLAGHFASVPVVTRAQLDGVVKLLSIYAEHIGELAGRRLLAQQNARRSAVAEALLFVHEHQTERLQLSAVAQHAQLSPFYFCKLFKKTMGMTFTDYLVRTRIEKAKDLLLNPATRVSDVALAAGFGSIPHFNRTFKRYTATTPTAYRAAQLAASPAPSPWVAAGSRQPEPAQTADATR